MEPHQQRVVDELAALETKLRKLRLFLDTETFAHADDTDRALLGMQYGHMIGYRECLKKRLAHWGVRHEQDTRVESEGCSEVNHQGGLFEEGPKVPD